MGGRVGARMLCRAVVVGAAVAMLAACGNSSASPGTASGAKRVNGGTLTIRGNRDFDSWDPASCTTCREYASAFYATLLALNSSGRIVPYLASSYTATATSVMFKLR